MKSDLLHKIVKKKLYGSHDYSHIERVVGYAKKINTINRGNWKIIESSLLLHEITKSNPESSRVYLKDFSENEIRQIIYCIQKHHNFIDKPNTLEAKVVQDADILDMLGAIGIARGFMSGGERNLSLIDTKDEYKKKRLKLFDFLNLEESKKIGKKRYEFTKFFFKAIDKELESEKIKF